MPGRSIYGKKLQADNATRIVLLVSERDALLHQKAESLSSRLGLPLIRHEGEIVTDRQLPLTAEFDHHCLSGYDFALLVCTHGLMLKDLQSSMRPLLIDFSKFSIGTTGSRPSVNRKLLVRAVRGRVKRAESDHYSPDGFHPDVIDCTAGLGRDAFQLALAGFRVLMIEKDAVMSALLADALQRAEPEADATAVSDRLRLEHSDALVWLDKSRERFTAQQRKSMVAYIDTMFPEKKGTALVKREMQFLQSMIGPRDGCEELVLAARSAGFGKIVIKRPVHWKWKHAFKINATINSKVIRYDVVVP